MPSEDLKSYASSDTDFYELLGITFESSQRDLDRQWRRTALKYHPDKVGNDATAREKFHLAQIGYDLLSDPALKALYDNARNARLQRKRQNELFEGKRRQMKDDLEARERGVKRTRENELNDEEKLERELRRLAEDGKRRRKEREDALKQELLEETLQESQATTPAADGENGITGVCEIDRTVTVRWSLEGQGGSINQERIKSLFTRFGKIESLNVLTPKRLRMVRSKKKKLAAVCMIQYVSVVGAHAAVEDFGQQRGAEWDILDSVFWAANKEPNFLNISQSDAPSLPSTPARPNSSGARAAFLNGGNKPSTPAASTDKSGDGLRKMPSFSSFSSSAFNTPKGSPFGKSVGVNSPSLEEMTMIRLKNAEKKRLAEEIERQDEEAAAAEAKQS